MIKEALEYIIGLNDSIQYETINDKLYCNKQMHLVDEYNKIKPIRLHSLTSLVDYVKTCEQNIPDKMYLVINEYNSISLIGHLDKDNQRDNVIECSSNTVQFRFGEWHTQEQFNIALQSLFVDNEDRALLLTVMGNLEAGSVAKYGDDGVTQKATIKSGVSVKQDIVVPNPVTLIPYRSFLEVGHPATQFIFRLKQDDRTGEVKAALFEADGGAWKMQIMDEIKKYLEESLKEFENINILA